MDLDYLRSIMERGPSIVYHCQEYWDYGVDYISPNVQTLLGWSYSDFIDNPVFRQEIIHPDDIHDVLREVPKLLETGRQTHEYRLRKKNGDYIWVMDDVRSVKGPDGQLEGLIGFITDITDLKEAERALRESEIRHRTIFETVLEGIITINERGIIQDINGAAERMFGYGPHEIVGKNISILVPEPHASNHDDYIAKFCQTGEARVIGIGREVQGLRKNGEIFEMGLAISELNLPDGRYFVGCVRDITVRVRAVRELRESRERLHTSQRFAKIGTWDWDVGADVLHCSDQVGPLIGVEDNNIEITSDFFIKRTHEDDKSALKMAMRACLKEGQELNIEHRILVNDGMERWMHVQGNVIRGKDGRVVRMLGVIHDITDQKQREKELEQARLNADMANKAKSEFLSRMSHELRTPLNAILGFAQLLGMSRKHPLGNRQKTQVDQIVTAGQHLLDLINEVLDLARIEAGRLSLSIESVDMGPVLDECITLTESLAAEKNISLSCANPLEDQLFVDRTRLKQILLNLLSNAVKYNDEGGSVHVEVEKLKDRFIRFSVIDNGAGIPLQRQDQLFTPFSRLGAEEGSVEGTGIGLTITKQLIETMGGEIGFESRPGVGTTFWVNVPIVPEGFTLEGPLTAMPLATLSEPKTLLYVEDNQANRDMMEQLVLSIGNLNVICASNADSGLAIAQKQKLDAILLDINMEGMNGIEAARILRHVPELHHTPIYALSADESQETIDEAMAAGFNGYFIKPLQVSDFTEKLVSIWSGEK